MKKSIKRKKSFFFLFFFYYNHNDRSSLYAKITLELGNRFFILPVNKVKFSNFLGLKSKFIVVFSLLLDMDMNFNSFDAVSASFSDGGMMPDIYGCNGGNIQFNLSWSEFPADTEFFAIIMDDPEYTYVHWSVFNISVFDTSIAEDGEIGGVIGMNDDGRNDYYGPCPPSGTHTYVTSVYALSGALDPTIADSPVTRAQFESGEFSSAILAKGTIISEYESN